MIQALADGAEATSKTLAAACRSVYRAGNPRAEYVGIDIDPDYAAVAAHSLRAKPPSESRQASGKT